jgi:anti-sigma regulatory factor (Ser/Thr protein kinase)
MRVLTDFSVPSQPGNERQVADRVSAAVAEVHLDQRQVERLATAVAEATLNAMEHGNHFLRDRPVGIRVEVSQSQLRVSITDSGCGPGDRYEQPDLDKKLAGTQSPRGWGLFLIEKMVDEVCESEKGENGAHTVRLSVHLRPGQVAG